MPVNAVPVVGKLIPTLLSHLVKGLPVEQSMLHMQFGTPVRFKRVTASVPPPGVSKRHPSFAWHASDTYKAVCDPVFFWYNVIFARMPYIQ